MLLTTQHLASIAGRPANSNMASVMMGLKEIGDDVALNPPNRLAMYLAQNAHESMGWHYDRELWGPTKAQLGYEGRKDLGNIYPGDGSKFRGRTGGQITGRTNTTEFRDWAQRMDPAAPDFVADPDLMNTDPWEGYGPLWYWDSRRLNTYADRGDFDGVTYRINGGQNGRADRRRYYGRAAMVLLGRSPNDLRAWQAENGLAADNIVGPKTIAKLHAALSKLPPVQFTSTPVRVTGTDWLSRLLAAIFGAFK